jgi:hypothetical protein
MLTEVIGVSCLYISTQEGHLDVVKVLLEAGGRELLMLTKDDGESYGIACRANQGEVCRREVESKQRSVHDVRSKRCISACKPSIQSGVQHQH